MCIPVWGNAVRKDLNPTRAGCFQKSNIVSDCNRQNSLGTSREVLIPLYKSLVRLHPEQMTMDAKFKEEPVKTRANKIIKRRENLFYGLE